MKMNGFSNSKIDSTQIDIALFDDACHKVIRRETHENGIGTLREKTVHSVLKNYYVPNPQYHEIPIGNYVTDICREGEIYEIQSKAFYTMKSKLDFFLPDYEVTIIYPIAVTKYVRWINPETGEIAAPRKSNKKGHLYDIIPELYSIRELLGHEHLHFIACFIEMEEYKLMDGYGKDHKLHATKTDRIPTKLLGEFRIDQVQDLLKFLPMIVEDSVATTSSTISASQNSSVLTQPFSSKDLSGITGCSLEQARYLLTLLHTNELIKFVGKKNRYHLYGLS